MLKQILDKYENKEFIWGEHDCCLFSANVHQELTGIDYAKEFRGKYSTEDEAWELAGDLKEFLINILNKEPSTDFENCKSGYPVLFNDTERYALGICYGERAYFITKLGRYFKVPLRKCECFWKLG